MGATKTSAGRFMEFNMEQSFTEYGITSDPPEAKSIKRIQISESKTGIPKAKAVKIRYGSYTNVPRNLATFLRGNTTDMFR